MTETCRLRFQEPLDPMDELTIQLLTERYEGADGTPFMKITSEGRVTLIVPQIIRPTFMRKKETDESKSVEATSLLPVPSNG